MLATTDYGQTALALILALSTPDFSWVSIGQTVALFFIGVFSAVTAWRQKKQLAAAEIARVLQAEQKVVLDQVHELGNSRMGAELLTGLAAARSNYAGTPTPENKQLLAVAQQKYDEHQIKQERADEIRRVGPKAVKST